MLYETMLLTAKIKTNSKLLKSIIMLKAKIKTRNLAGNCREIVKDFKSEAHLQAYLKVITLSPYSKLTGVNTNLEDELNNEDKEEILSNCCGADPSYFNKSLCGQCLEHSDFN